MVVYSHYGSCTPGGEAQYLFTGKDKSFGGTFVRSLSGSFPDELHYIGDNFCDCILC